MTLQTIINELNCPIMSTSLSIRDQEEVFNNVKLLLKNQTSYKKNSIYIATYDFVTNYDFHDFKGTMIIIHDSSQGPTPDMPTTMQYVLLNSHVDLFDLFNQVNALFSRDLILDTMRDCSNLTSLSSKISDQLKNPVIIIDGSYHILAHSAIENITDTIWQQNLNRGYCSYEFIAYVRNMKAISDPNNNRKPFVLKCYKSPIERWATKIYLHGKLIGYLIVLIEAESLDENDKRLLSEISLVAATFIEQKLQPNTPDNFAQESLLMDLLDHRITTSTLLEDKRHLYEENFKENFVIMVFDVANFNGKAKPTGYLYEQINKILNRRHVYYEDYIVLLYDFTCEPFMTSFKKEKLKDFTEKNQISVGISNPFTDLLSLKYHYLQGKKVLSQKANRSQSITHFKEIAFQSFINDATALNLHVEDYLHPSLATLKHYDAMHDTDLYKTLYIYLKNNQNSVLSGTELFLHRNTVKYRMDKIIALTNLDFSNNAEVFFIMFSFRSLGLD